jgi:hypothetical protein
MNTTRIDHTNCSHDRNARGRAWCRETRRDAIKRAQAAYGALWTLETPAGEMYDEYHALVEDVIFRLGVDRAEAYDIVENGPVVS